MVEHEGLAYEVHVEAVGAAGANSPAAHPGGRGDGVSGTFGLAPEEILGVCVDDGGGAGGAAEGGGFSGAFDASGALVFAGGGGGAGEGTLPPSTVYPENGAGGNAGSDGESGEHELCGGGGGGTLYEAGNPGSCFINGEPGYFGTAGYKETGGVGSFKGGGGGGGYHGGGGGGGYAGGGGGADDCGIFPGSGGGGGVLGCETHFQVGTVHGAGAGANEAHVTLTLTTLSGPTVTKVYKTSGPATGDMLVTVTGTNLKFARGVTFGGIVASKYSVNAAGTEIGVVAPPQEVAGTVDVTVTTPAGTSAVNKKDLYKYLPVITRIEPNTGPTSGGEVHVFGAGFESRYEEPFSFGTITTIESICNHTECVVKAPPHAAGKVDIKTIVNGAASAKTKADQYTYK